MRKMQNLEFLLLTKKENLFVLKVNCPLLLKIRLHPLDLPPRSNWRIGILIEWKYLGRYLWKILMIFSEEFLKAGFPKLFASHCAHNRTLKLGLPRFDHFWDWVIFKTFHVATKFKSGAPTKHNLLELKKN